MTTTIDSAGRVVIPKSLRERAGLEAGTRIDFRFHDGVIEIVVATDPLEWERVGRVRYPVFTSPGLTTEEIRDAIEAGRDERLEA